MGIASLPLLLQAREREPPLGFVVIVHFHFEAMLRSADDLADGTIWKGYGVACLWAGCVLRLKLLHRTAQQPHSAPSVLAAMGQAMDTMPSLTCTHEPNWSDEESEPEDTPGPQTGSTITFPDGSIGKVIRRTQHGFKVEMNDDDETERWFPLAGLEK